MKAYRRALEKDGVTVERLIAGARAYAADRRQVVEAKGEDEARYTAHPTTWLNDERWNDEPPGGAALPSLTDAEQYEDHTAKVVRYPHKSWRSDWGPEPEPGELFAAERLWDGRVLKHDTGEILWEPRWGDPPARDEVNRAKDRSRGPRLVADGSAVEMAISPPLAPTNRVTR